MGKIRQLPPDLISKIAAGEVIERPSYAVKELIENSIDAGATFIKINIEDSGLRKIQIADNGEGMDKEDLEKCFLPHSTSKLEDDSLSKIKTLGFRGEALSSIAAISDIKIISRRSNNHLGYVLQLSNGSIINASKIGAPVGTTITVQNLFSPVPARKKFLKSLRTEHRYILETIINFALSFPNIQFEFIHNKKIVLDLPPTKNLFERIKTTQGSTIFENLIPISYEESYFKISGFLCKPQIYSSTTQKQFLFVNNRKINDSLISSSIKESYGHLLDSNSHPIFIVFLELPLELVDINVHPRKEQIAFHHNQLIYDFVYKAVTKTLSENNLTFYNLSFAKITQRSANLSFKGTDNSSTNYPNFSNGVGLTTSYAGKILKSEVLPWLNYSIGKTSFDDLIQIHNLYLICQTKNGIAIIDQHAAHEGILYEQFLKKIKKHQSKHQSYSLKKAVLLNLSPSYSEILLDNLSIFENLGFLIDQFGENTFKIDSVPLLFQDRDLTGLINEVLEDLDQYNTPKDVDSQTNKMLQYLACRSAIKAGDKLTKQQAKDLIKDLSQINGLYTCPHGRPVKIEIPLSQLDKLFKRK